MKALIVYYSYTNGNTKKIAEELQQAIGGDIERIEPVKPYGSYEATVEEGQMEVQKGYKRPIQKLPYDVADYDVIALGTPTWWYTMAPCMHTFISQNDFKGKKVILFMTNGGWPGSVIKHMKAQTQADEILGIMEVQFDSTGGVQQVTSQREVDAWLMEMKKKVK